MKKNLCLLLLLIAAYSTLHCTEEAPEQQSMNSAPERRASTGRRLSLTGRSMAQIAPMPIPDNNTGPAGAGVGVGAGEGLVHPTLVHQDALRASAPKPTVIEAASLTGEGLTAVVAAMQMNLDREGKPFRDMIARENEMVTGMAKEELAEQLKRGQEVVKTLRGTRKSDLTARPKRLSALKDNTHFYDSRGYNNLPPTICDCLIDPASSADRETQAQIRIHDQIYNLHKYSGICYAARSNADGSHSYFKLTHEGFIALTEDESMYILGGKLNIRNSISYGQLHDISKKISDASLAQTTTLIVTLTVPLKDPYTVHYKKGNIYGVQKTWGAKFTKALGTNNESELFMFSLFNILLHTTDQELLDSKLFATDRPCWKCC